ncbi:hypothetical protein D3C86_2153410 [compost metagenome]
MLETVAVAPAGANARMLVSIAPTGRVMGIVVPVPGIPPLKFFREMVCFFSTAFLEISPFTS